MKQKWMDRPFRSPHFFVRLVQETKQSAYVRLCQHVFPSKSLRKKLSVFGQGPHFVIFRPDIQRPGGSN